VWKPSRLSEGSCYSSRTSSGKNTCRNTGALSSKVVAPLIVASEAGSLGSAFLTVCQRDEGLVFSTTVFQ